MNKKGFTLIELIAVLGLLGLLITISVPTITNILKNNKQTSLDRIQDTIVTAAKNYAIDYSIDAPATIQMSDLCQDYIECPITNPVTEENLTGCVKVTLDSRGIEVYTFVTTGC